jgi:hypothetical protein
MHYLIWLGMIVWGALVTAVGLAQAGSPGDVPPQDVALLLAGGLLSCLLGALGLTGLLDWLPGGHEKSARYVRHRTDC